MCVELLTPDGNWSSYPPHRHDTSPECPVNNEEIYYFRVGRAGQDTTSPDGFAFHRTYTPTGSSTTASSSATVTFSASPVVITGLALPRRVIRFTISMSSPDRRHPELGLLR